MPSRRALLSTVTVASPSSSQTPMVVRAMHVVGINLSGRTPREITFEETQESDYVITMGCSADGVCPAGWAGENRDWNLDDSDGKSAAEVGRIRDEIERRVNDLFDEVENPR